MKLTWAISIVYSLIMSNSLYQSPIDSWRQIGMLMSGNEHLDVQLPQQLLESFSMTEYLKNLNEVEDLMLHVLSEIDSLDVYFHLLLGELSPQSI